MIDDPVRRRVAVDHTLIEVAASGAEILDRQVTDRDVAGVVGEGVIVNLPSVEDRTRRADESRAISRPNLRIPARTESVNAGSEPVRLVRTPEVDTRVTSGSDPYRSGRG